METVPRIRVVLVDDEETVIASVKLVLRKHPQIEVVGTGTNGREALQLANRLRPDVLLIDVNMPVLNGLEATARITQVFPSIGVVILTSEDAPDTIKQALRSGALDFLSKCTDLKQVGEAILKADRGRNRDAPSKGLANVWGFYGPKGSAGTTTMAINVAADLALLDYKVLLCDLDPLQGDCAFYLNALGEGGARPRTLLESLEALTTIDQATLDRFVVRYPLENDRKTTLDVLPSPCRFLELGPGADEKFSPVMEALQAQYDYIVIDLPSTRLFEPVNVAAIDCCERLFLVVNSDLPSVKSLLTIVKVLRDLAFSESKLSVLLSSVVVDPGLGAAEYIQEKILKAEITEVPLAPEVHGSHRLGKPTRLTSPNSTLSRAVSALTSKCLNILPAKPERREKSGWDRIKGALFGAA